MSCVETRHSFEGSSSVRRVKITQIECGDKREAIPIARTIKCTIRYYTSDTDRYTYRIINHQIYFAEI